MQLHADESPQSHTILEELYDAADLSKRNITAQIKRDGRPIGGGAFADVVQGTWNIPHQQVDPITGHLVSSVETRQVAIKDIRVFDKRHSSWKKIINRLFHEIGIWCWLDHINILPFYGYSLDEHGRAALISPWCEFGTLPDFMKEHPEASRENLVLDVAEGMAYLHNHSPPIIHGDMKGTNILVNQHGIACIADFGISMFVEDACVLTGFTTTVLSGGSTRWMAPELHHFEVEDEETEGEEAKTVQKTFASDMYALGGVLLEVLTGKIPYYYLRTDSSVIIEIHQGKLPRAAKYGFNEEDFIWTIIKTLWNTIPANRPSAQAISNTLYAHYLLRPREIHTQTQRPSGRINGAFVQWNLPASILPIKLSWDGATLCCITYPLSMIAFINVKKPPFISASWRWTLPENYRIYSKVCVWNPSSSLVAVCLEKDGTRYSQSVVLLNVRAQTGVILQLPFSNRIHKIAFNVDDSLTFVLKVDDGEVLAACRLSNNYTTLQSPHSWILMHKYGHTATTEERLAHNGTYVRTDPRGHVYVTELSGANMSTELSQIDPPHRLQCRSQSSFFVSIPTSIDRPYSGHQDGAPHLSTLYYLSIFSSTPSQTSFNSRVAATKVEICVEAKRASGIYAECKGWLIYQLGWDSFGIWHYSTPRLLATMKVSNGETNERHLFDKHFFSVHENFATIVTAASPVKWRICQFFLPPIT